ncbi:vWA domain-containing protein [Shewanella litorisediminis]|uniref:VWA domain-containing protein n=1 Tax=Shewanella litorisediminis TaxID=1173586 RepID=A0ABX7FZE0_9GAMM|nr:VWA domain-containing protein [Shewanella litorisediminis]MCL2919512.1 VWA domain-containing protein [Shewanella litorisediminis]QRH00450.1 VWA domain-containing protein [Shewanella litorisediminis]
MIHFIRPEWLLLFIPLMPLLWFLNRRQGAISAWQGYIAPHLARVLLTDSTSRRSGLGFWWLGAAWSITTVALSGPAVTKEAMPVFAAGAARVLVIDMSISMYATDLPPNRLTQARFRAIDLINQLSDGDTALVAYAGDAFVISPLTRDKATLLNLLPSLSPDIMPLLGSSPASGVSLARDLLIQGGHPDGDIVLMTDGLDMVDVADVKRALKGSPFRLAVYGFGTAQGAPMKLPNGSFVRGNDDNLVLPKLDAELLDELAQSERGIWQPSTLDGSDIGRLVQWLSREGEATDTELTGDTWQDLGPYLALLLLLPALLSFRRGMLASMLLPAMLTLSVISPDAGASIWQTRDQQAMEAFRQQDFATAANEFEREDWKAAAHYRAGNYEAALQGFEKDSSAAGLYNQGNALMQLGRYDEAAKRYQKALQLQPDMEDAKRNAALAKALDEMQKSQQAQNSQDGQPSSDESQQQNSQSQQGDTQQSGSEQGQNPQQGSDKSSNDPSGDGQQQGSEGSQGSADAHSRSETAKESASNPDKDLSDQGAANQSGGSQSASNQSAANQTSTEQSSNDEGSDPDSKADKSSNEAPMSADVPMSQQDAPAPTDEPAAMNGRDEEDGQSNKGNQAAQTSAQLAEGEQQEDGEQAQVGVIDPTLKESDLPPEMLRALKSVNDDPSVLLRNKMQLEYQLRRARGEHRQEKEKW